MKNRKSILFLFPILAICLPLLIFPVYAAGFSGECGDNVVWNLSAYDCGSLQISGFGKMDDWDWDATPSNMPPWAELTRDFVELHVQNGVTHIGDDAFAGCRYLALAYLPDSVTSIGNDAFYACHGLWTEGGNALFDLPAGIVSIGEHAFHGCGDLSRISLPDTLEYIGNDAFYDCGSIMVTLSRSLYNKFSFDEIFSGNTEVMFDIREDGSPIIPDPGNPDDKPTHSDIPSDPNSDDVTNPRFPTVESIPVSGTVYARAQTMKLDGKGVEFQCYAVKDTNGNESNYVKVRDLAQALNGTKAQFNVGWDGKISLTSNTPYQAAGGEGSTPYSGNQPYTAVSDTPVSFNGSPVKLTSFTITYQGGGYTYYKLRDLGQLLNFNVKWDGGVVIETDKPYTGK